MSSKRVSKSLLEKSVLPPNIIRRNINTRESLLKSVPLENRIKIVFEKGGWCR